MTENITHRLIFLKALAEGERWITVRSPGAEKGSPVLVRENPDGSASVIGGAGGKLNHLKLRGVKSKEQYKKEAGEKEKSKREAKKQETAAQRVKDKEAGITESKAKVRTEIKEQARAEEREYVKATAKVMGWDEKDLTFDEEKHADLSPAAVTKLAREHHRELVKKANEAYDLNRQSLAMDSEARQQANIGGATYEPEDPDSISVADLDVTAGPPTGLGFSADYKGRAEEAGLTDPELEKEAGQVREKKQAQMSEGERKAAINRGQSAKLIKQELAGVREEDPGKSERLKAHLVEADKALELMKAKKRLDLARKKAHEALKSVDKSNVEPKAYVLEVDSADVDSAVENQVTNDLRTIRTRNFLSEAGKVSEKSIGAHVASGAFNSINSLSLAATGAGLMDRSTVDVLGIAGAASVMARRLHTDLTPEEMEQVADGMEDFHQHHYMDLSKKSLEEAKSLTDQVESMTLPTADNGGDMAALQEINARRRDALNESTRILGTAAGEMEANAALVQALRDKPADKLEIPMGKAQPEAIIRQARALGLQRGDYSIDPVGGQTFLTITASGMDRLAEPVDRESMQQIRRNLDIIEGKQDEDQWLPQGFANRPDLDLKPAPGVAAKLAIPFEVGADAEQSLADYIGGRAADGDSPADIVADLQSETFMQKAGDRRAEYMQALDKLAPAQDADGKQIRNESLQSSFEKMADEFVEKRYGAELTPLHRQQFDMDQTSVDALHRALAAEPSGVAAYKPIGELDHKDQRALREYFAREVAHESPEAGEIRKKLDTLVANEPEQHVTDMFGEQANNPEWLAWKSERDDLSAQHNSSSLSWGKYVKAMGGTAKAYEAAQDLIRSKIAKGFHENYNTLNPKGALKLGHTVIRNNLDHLDTVDPKARAAREAKETALRDGLRERVGGKYASGSVIDKLDQQREQQAAFEQSQLGMFSSEEMPATEQEKALGADERYTLGHAAEQKIASMMSVVGKNFKPGQALKLWQPTMSGTGAPRQRAIKLLDANKRVGLAFGVGTGKAQPLDAKVLTPTGWARMGDLQVGDLVIAGDGTPTRVTGVYPQGSKEIYRVTFADGGQTECCDEHLWLTQTEVERKRQAYGGDRLAYSSVRSLEEIRSSLVVRHGLRNHSIPVCGPAKFISSDVPVSPYLLGMLIGDGDMSATNAVKFSTGDEILAQYVRDHIMDGVNVDKCKSGKYEYRFNGGGRGGDARPRNHLVVALDNLGLMNKKSSAKFVPDQYKFNSFDVRLGMLQGLMDTDGTVDKRNGSVSFCTVSERLRDDVIFLAQSLGGIATVTSRIPSYTHKGETLEGQRAFMITLRLPAGTNPFRMPRKRDLVVDKSKYAPKRRFIDSVELVGKKEAQCISVEHPSHLYVTDDLIVTHNTAIGLGGFSHLHEQGKIKKGLFVVPSIVQGQFGGEALRYLEPGKFKWHAEPGASFESRLQAYKDPENSFTVVTHQSFRDDMVKLGAQHAGIPEDQMSQKLGEMSRGDRKAWIRAVMDKEGIDHQYIMVDEGHNTLNRKGKEDSGMANVIDAATDNSEYFVSATADPVKNDLSELHDAMTKLAGGNYMDRDTFMRKYGVDTAASKDSLRREMARYFYPSKIDPETGANRQEIKVQLNDNQKTELEKIDRHALALRLARMGGRVDIESAKALAPEQFAGVPEENHEAIAKALQKNIGLLKRPAVRRVINNHPDGAKFEAAVNYARERKGKPGVFFTRSLEGVAILKARLEKEGFRVATITGADSSKEKEAKRQMFNPEGGAEAQADILVASDAAATGMNIQRGQWLTAIDTPETAMTHAQRQGRIYRTGQKNDVELADLVADHPMERADRARLQTKYALRDLVTSPLEGLDDSGLAFFLKQRRDRQQEQSGSLF